jgi:hypothetical protein
MIVTIETPRGPKKVRVCDYCKSACIPSGRYCSGHCARGAQAQRELAANERANQAQVNQTGSL